MSKNVERAARRPPAFSFHLRQKVCTPRSNRPVRQRKPVTQRLSTPPSSCCGIRAHAAASTTKTQNKPAVVAQPPPKGKPRQQHMFIDEHTAQQLRQEQVAAFPSLQTASGQRIEPTQPTRMIAMRKSRTMPDRASSVPDAPRSLHRSLPEQTGRSAASSQERSCNLAVLDKLQPPQPQPPQLFSGGTKPWRRTLTDRTKEAHIARTSP